MKTLTFLERIRGWLPKEVNLSSRQPVSAGNRFFPTRKAAVMYIVLIAGSAAVGGLVGAIGEISGVSSRLGIFWPIIISMAIAITGALLYGRLYRKEQQKKAQP